MKLKLFLSRFIWFSKCGLMHLQTLLEQLLCQLNTCCRADVCSLCSQINNIKHLSIKNLVDWHQDLTPFCSQWWTKAKVAVYCRAGGVQLTVAAPSCPITQQDLSEKCKNWTLFLLCSFCLSKPQWQTLCFMWLLHNKILAVFFFPSQPPEEMLAL